MSVKMKKSLYFRNNLIFRLQILFERSLDSSSPLFSNLVLEFIEVNAYRGLRGDH